MGNLSLMKVLDLFSGIGGFSLGLERAGMETVAFVEIDEKARRVLQKHWPSTPIYTDVREITKERLERDGITGINIVCGGFPCQDISSAGNREGLSGSRSGLWYEFHRIIKEVKPDYAVIENVSDLRSRGLDEVLRGLHEIGYDAEWHCIPASYFGAPHRRDRVWILAYPHDQGESVSPFNDEAPRLQAISRDGGRHWRDGFSGDVRMADGLPGGMDQVKQLGNSVVPQIPEAIGRSITDG
jgi:DNA (cytosine-5)-methyltransferase 1